MASGACATRASWNALTGVHVEDISEKVKPQPGNVMDISATWAYRSWVRVAVEVKLVNLGAKPWTPAGRCGTQTGARSFCGT